MSRCIPMTLLLAALLTGPAHAILIKMELPELSQKAARIVVADVESLAVERLPENGELWTIARLKVRSHVKGSDGPAEVFVRIRGGKDAQSTQLVRESPVYRQGEQVVAFLVPHEEFEGHWHTLGWRQGKFTVEGKLVKERNVPLPDFINTVAKLAAGSE